MYILHGTWAPGEQAQLENPGRFVLWIEQEETSGGQGGGDAHPFAASGAGLAALIAEVLPAPVAREIDTLPTTAWLWLPSANAAPLPSPELGQLLGADMPEQFHWQPWRVAAMATTDPLLLLKELHFQSIQLEDRLRLGSDIRFWHRFSRAVRDLVRRQAFVPAILPWSGPTTDKRGRGRKTQEPAMHFATGWLPFSAHYDACIAEFAPIMPVLCRVLSDAAPSETGPGSPAVSAPPRRDAEAVLRGFTQQTYDNLVARTKLPQKTLKAVEGTFLTQALLGGPAHPAQDCVGLETWQHWERWRQRLEGGQGPQGLQLGFRLQEAPPNQPDDWYLEWLAASRQDPGFQLPLADYWGLEGPAKAAVTRRLGGDLAQQLLIQVGQAARVVPALWAGLETERPVGISLDRGQALAFLREHAWVLEESGYRVLVPSWWTPAGRRRARLRLRASSPRKHESGGSSGDFSLPSVVRYRYELSIGGETVTPEDWAALLASKSELVQFRGQWIQIDRAGMADVLRLLEQPGEREMPLAELLQRAAGAQEEGIELAFEDALGEMLERLRDPGGFALADPPPTLAGTLRGYQQRGLSWLRYLERTGLGMCLADDMGLGKTVQVIALLLAARDGGHAGGAGADAGAAARVGGHASGAGADVGAAARDTGHAGGAGADAGAAARDTGHAEDVRAILRPTLLVAPTSVLGNWQRELRRFAPSLTSYLHHGPDRPQQAKAFRQAIAGQDVVITSYGLLRRDAGLFQGEPWARVVVDEAQNLKNPHSAQSRAVQGLKTRHRLALTGTPIENRLLDLWSLFHFLNPGYLGSAAAFKKRFEQPIQREQDQARAATLKRLVEPFILRRVKSDKRIIQDLPDKVEQKVYCNLTPEQAALYQSVVDDVQGKLEAADGIQRRGLMLATLMRLKQICNHPAQFLQDGSPFLEARSHKLERVSGMVQEVMAEGESLLLFTQFTEIGDALERLFRQQYRYPVHYLHGGTSRLRREQMIQSFQDPASDPAIFVLSLKAGGVGITLTRANHVFHFDRWWNPAVENQATDRAYRIGQEKRVFVHKLVTLGTLEERIDRVLEDKQRLAETIVGSDEAWLTELDNDAFRRLIELNRAEAVIE